jgi:hypothetical protein
MLRDPAHVHTLRRLPPAPSRSFGHGPQGRNRRNRRARVELVVAFVDRVVHYCTDGGEDLVAQARRTQAG